ncbi:hypothetical protein [Ralstonia phage RSP15]|uniref:hypothetical protein n=1 Tax=Ralstonia phage RSP15 TaxID=1785960 RepID=UPI00074D3472|nr:hypothetical protein BH754_gp223 [Ralstonia phage RSP15]BAU40083.1 hypothetical protein [Ralstonia phage RSP15]
MTKEDLIQFLKDNLVIELRDSTEYGFYGSAYLRVSATIKIGDEEITSDSLSIQTQKGM